MLVFVPEYYGTFTILALSSVIDSSIHRRLPLMSPRRQRQGAMPAQEFDGRMIVGKILHRPPERRRAPSIVGAFINIGTLVNHVLQDFSMSSPGRLVNGLPTIGVALVQQLGVFLYGRWNLSNIPPAAKA